MQVVHKYKLLLTDNQIITLPVEYAILDIMAKGLEIFMWLQHETSFNTQQVQIKIYSTGEIIAPIPGMTHKFLKTVYLGNGEVYHIYKVFLKLKSAV